MRVLLIACSYPPAPVVGSFRAAKLARAFRDAGHEVDVVASRLPDERDAVRLAEPGLCVHTVREVPGLRSAYRSMKRRVVRETAPPPSNGSGPAAGGTGPKREMPAWKRYPLSLLFVPDDRQGFIPAALARSIPLVRRGVDLVYTTAPPFSGHLVGLALKRITGVRWAAEFRDPWTENRPGGTRRSPPADALNRLLERSCVTRADHLIGVSEGIRDLLISKLPADRHERVLLALNGIDNLTALNDVVRNGGPFRIVHTGSFYGGRDPRQFLRALAAVTRRRGLNADHVRVEFIGDSRSYRGESLEHFAAEHGVAEFIEFHDWMPQEEARARAATADLLLLPFPHRRLIPNKLYDYLGLRKPILAFVSPNGEAARMLARLPGHYLVTDGQQDAAEQALEAALVERSALSYDPDAEGLLASWTTPRQMAQLVRSLEGAGR